MEIEPKHGQWYRPVPSLLEAVGIAAATAVNVAVFAAAWAVMVSMLWYVPHVGLLVGASLAPMCIACTPAAARVGATLGWALNEMAGAAGHKNRRRIKAPALR